MSLKSVLLCLTLALGSLAAAWSAPSKQLTVLVASSLKEFMDDAAPAFEKAHPGIKVRTSIAASSELRVQIEQGAPADVFLSADTANMDPLLTARLIQKPVIFTKNTLAIIVSKHSRVAIAAPADLAKPNATLVLAAPEVPIGNYSRQVLRKMDASGKYGKNFASRVVANVKSNEPSTRSVAAKVALGEADAGIVYITDVTPDVRRVANVVAIPDEMNVTATYPAAVVSRSRNRELARDFVAFLRSEQGKDLLRKRGFAP